MEQENWLGWLAGLREPKPGDLISVWAWIERCEAARGPMASRRKPRLMRVLAAYGRRLVCAPFAPGGRWSAAAVVVPGGAVARAAPDAAALAKAEADMPRFRLHVARLVEGDRASRLLGKICPADRRRAVAAACGLPDGADLWFGQRGLSDAFREVDELEAQWASPPRSRGERSFRPPD